MKNIIDLSLEDYMTQYRPVYKPVIAKVSKSIFSMSAQLGYYSVRMADYRLCSSGPNENADEKRLRIAVKKAYATLRKAIRAYRHSALYRHKYLADAYTSTSWDTWTLSKETLLYFADWFVLPDELETLFAQADATYEQQRIAYEQKHAEAKRTSVWRNAYAQKKAYALGVLGVSETATPEDIKSRYRALAKVHHPDMGGNAEDFIRIQTAYQALITE